MNILLIPISNEDANLISNFKGPTIETLKYVISKKGFVFDYLILYLVNDSDIAKEKSFKLFSKYVDRFLKDKIKDRNVNIYVRINDITLSNFDQLEKLTCSIYSNLTHLPNVSVNKNVDNIFVLINSGKIMFDLALLLLAYKFDDKIDVNYLQYERIHELENQDSYDVKKVFKKILSSKGKVNKKDCQFKKVDFVLPYLENKDTTFEKFLKKYSYEILKNYLLKNSYKISDNLHDLLEIGISLENNNRSYFDKNEWKYSFIPHFKYNDDENKKYYNGILLSLLNTEILFKHYELSGVVANIDGLLKEVIFICLYYLSNGKSYNKYIYYMEGKNKSGKQINLSSFIKGRVFIDFKKIRNSPSIYETMKKYYDTKEDYVFVNSKSIAGLTIYYLRHSYPELTKIIDNCINLLEEKYSMNMSIWELMNNLTHKINRKPNNLEPDSEFENTYQDSKLLRYLKDILIDLENILSYVSDDKDISLFNLLSSNSNSNYFRSKILAKLNSSIIDEILIDNEK